MSETELLKIIYSQVNGQDGRKVEAVMRIVPEEEEEEYLPSCEGVLKIWQRWKIFYCDYILHKP